MSVPNWKTYSTESRISSSASCEKVVGTKRKREVENLKVQKNDLVVVDDPHPLGNDFLHRLVDFCKQEFESIHKLDITGNERSMRRLRDGCEIAKRTLSSSTTAHIEFGFGIYIEVDTLYLLENPRKKNHFHGIDFSTSISRAQLEELGYDFNHNLTTSDYEEGESDYNPNNDSEIESDAMDDDDYDNNHDTEKEIAIAEAKEAELQMSEEKNRQEQANNAAKLQREVLLDRHQQETKAIEQRIEKDTRTLNQMKTKQAMELKTLDATDAAVQARASDTLKMLDRTTRVGTPCSCCSQPVLGNTFKFCTECGDCWCDNELCSDDSDMTQCVNECGTSVCGKCVYPADGYCEDCDNYAGHLTCCGLVDSNSIIKYCEGCNENAHGDY